MHLHLQRLLRTLCGLLCATALFAIMALTFFDVSGRKLLSHSIPGSLELTELLMVVVIFAGLPLVSQRGEHVLFDSLDSVWPAWFVSLQKAVVHLLCAALMLALAWLMWNLGMQFMSYNDQTAQLQIPKSPFVFGMSLMCAITGVLHLTMMRGQPPESDEVSGAAL